MNEIMNIAGVDCYEKDGTAYLKLEAVARGLGFTHKEMKNGKEYESVRWSVVRTYLKELGFRQQVGEENVFPTSGENELGVATSCNGMPTSGHENSQSVGKERLPDFIPENIFYRLAMKAKNETAEKFQALVADEIIPSIRKHGAYLTPETLEQAILNPDTMIRLCTALKEEQDRNKALQAVNSSLTVDNQIMKPKADYFDELVDRNLLTNFRETAKQLQIKEKEFIRFLLDKKYIYRDAKGKIQPYADKNKGLFEVKEFANEKTGFASTQTLITPKGRETFRLLFLKVGA